jgi:hypothetical protein
MFRTNIVVVENHLKSSFHQVMTTGPPLSWLDQITREGIRATANR